MKDKILKNSEDTSPDQSAKVAEKVEQSVVPERIEVVNQRTAQVAKVALYSHEYLHYLNSLPGDLCSILEEIAKGSERKMLLIFNIYEKYGREGLKILLDLGPIYNLPKHRAALQDIELIAKYIEMVAGADPFGGAYQKQILVFFRSLIGQAQISNYVELNELIANLNFIVHESFRAGCLEGALTIEWKYSELILFIGNCKVSKVLLGESKMTDYWKAYLGAAQDGRVGRKFLI